MPASPRRAAEPADRTPSGRLAERGLHEVIGYQLAQATITTDAVFTREVGTPHGLRPVEYTLLQLITENEGCSSVRLAKALAVTKPNITMWVDRLVGRGLVERRPSEADRRAQELHATAEGRALAGSATRALRTAEGEVLARLSAAERAMLVELLHKVACAMPRA
jgi:DNA-binding MarR family transcriptional regulator